MCVEESEGAERLDFGEPAAAAADAGKSKSKSPDELPSPRVSRVLLGFLSLPQREIRFFVLGRFFFVRFV
jgi:hypothetical protein